MKTYTEREIKKWFEIMKKEYPNSRMLDSLESVEMLMFDKFCEYDNLEKVLKEGRQDNEK